MYFSQIDMQQLLLDSSKCILSAACRRGRSGSDDAKHVTAAPLYSCVYVFGYRKILWFRSYITGQI